MKEAAKSIATKSTEMTALSLREKNKLKMKT